MGKPEKSTFSAAARIFRFYYDGFTTMSWWGKRVWVIILIKLFIIFIVLKVFFFPDFLRKNYDSDAQRSEYVLDQLTLTTPADD
ncbi:MAG: DUF4492 domain-containing protein [Bacteroidales bacterium]|jgi:hypothetical protein|nr:DUF4492 domain-containing protein [Bacteroidales bacterium]